AFATLAYAVRRIAAHVVGEGAAICIAITWFFIQDHVQQVCLVVHADVVDRRDRARILQLWALLLEACVISRRDLVPGRITVGGIGSGHYRAPLAGSSQPSPARGGTTSTRAVNFLPLLMRGLAALHQA